MTDRHVSRRRMLQATGVAAATALAGCGGGGGDDGDDGGDGGAPDVEADEVVTLGGESEHTDPTSIEISVGDSVGWTVASGQHTVVPQDQPDEADWIGHTQVLSADDPYTHTFEVAGTYEWNCNYHGGDGTIEVSE